MEYLESLHILATSCILAILQISAAKNCNKGEVWSTVDYSCYRCCSCPSGQKPLQECIDAGMSSPYLCMEDVGSQCPNDPVNVETPSLLTKQSISIQESRHSDGSDVNFAVILPFVAVVMCIIALLIGAFLWRKHRSSRERPAQTVELESIDDSNLGVQETEMYQTTTEPTEDNFPVTVEDAEQSAALVVPNRPDISVTCDPPGRLDITDVYTIT